MNTNTMTVEVKKEGKTDILCIYIPMTAPHPSGSGKTLVVATTSGNQGTTAQVNGQPVTVGVNAYIKNPAYVKP